MLHSVKLALIKDLKSLETSLERREEYITIDTPLNEVNWCNWMDNLESSITVGDIDELIETIESATEGTLL